MAGGFPILVLVTGCAGMGTGAGPGPPRVLEFRVPEGGNVRYVRGDTMRISVDAGMSEAMDMRMTTRADLALDFLGKADGVEVTARFEEFVGRMTNPMAGPITATQEDIQGDLIFRLDRRGRPEVLQVPEVNDQAAQLARAVFLPYELFPRLPGRAAEAGATWTDTTYVSQDQGGLSTESTYITTYALRGDTLVEGRTLLSIDFTTAIETRTSGKNAGFEVQQEMTGESVGTVLWDPDRSLMVQSKDRTSLTGAVNVPAASMPPMTMRAEGTSRTTLKRQQDGA
jgi:hypothetical protein